MECLSSFVEPDVEEVSGHHSQALNTGRLPRGFDNFFVLLLDLSFSFDSDLASEGVGSALEFRVVAFGHLVDGADDVGCGFGDFV